MKINLIYKLLSINTDLKNIYYFFYAHSLAKIMDGESKYEVGFFVKEDIQRPEHLTQNFDYFWGKPETKVLYYEHPLPFGFKAKLLLDMSKDISSITVNKWYYHLVRFRIDNIWPPGLHLTNLVTIKLLQNKILTLHSASFCNKKTRKGYLVLGPSNIGKSVTTFAALKEGYDYHSEDITIMDKNFIYTTPLISAQSKSLPNKNLFLKYNLFHDKLGFLGLLLPKIYNLSTFHTFIAKQDIKDKAKVSKIFILERGNNEIHKITHSEALRKIIILNRLELTYYKDQLFRAYSYFNADLNVEDLLAVSEDLIKNIIRNTECYLVKAGNSMKYLKLIKEVIK